MHQCVNDTESLLQLLVCCSKRQDLNSLADLMLDKSCLLKESMYLTEAVQSKFFESLPFQLVAAIIQSDLLALKEETI